MSAPDVTSGFTDMQWYMYHQRNVAFFAAFTSRAFSRDDLLVAARALLDFAPQLGAGFDEIPDELLREIIDTERVESLDGLPDRWIDRGDAIFDEPGRPLFRLRHAALDRPDGRGRAGFLLVQVSHALVEGADSALLSRSHSAAHPVVRSTRPIPPLARFAGTVFGGVLASLHLLAGNLVNLRPGPFRYRSRAYPRALFSSLARELGVRQRALFFALAMATLFDQDKRRITSTYSVIDDRGGVGRDAYMRMRMRFAAFDNRRDFTTFVRAVDARLTEAEGHDSGFNDAMNAQGIHIHRKLSRILPFAYTPRLFQFMPYDVVIGLIPPHRLGGPLTLDLIEPVYAGAALEGANACVIVPGREQVSFNFYIEEKLLPRVSRLDTLLAHPVI